MHTDLRALIVEYGNTPVVGPGRTRRDVIAEIEAFIHGMLAPRASITDDQILVQMYNHCLIDKVGKNSDLERRLIQFAKDCIGTACGA